MKKKSKNTGNNFGSIAITLLDWQKKHPFPGRAYSSDNYYLNIAKRIALILEDNGFAGAYSKEDMRYMALNLAAYFEDVISELGIFRTFIQEYRRRYDREFPWYNVEEEYFLDDVNLVDVRFVLWLSMFACRDGSVPNPENPGMLEASQQIFDLFLDEFENAPVNKALVDEIYDTGVVEAAKLKTILMWLASSCYLLPVMYPIQRELKRSFAQLHEVFSPSKSNALMAAYLENSYKSVAQTCGPLALYPKDWYVLMRNSKDVYEGNEEILQVKASPVYPYAIVKDNGKTFTLRSLRGKEYEVDKKSFAQSELKMLRVGDIVVTMLFYYRGLWHVCGMAYNSYVHNLEIALENLDKMAEGFTDDMGRLVDLATKVDEDIPGNSPFGLPCDEIKCQKAVSSNQGRRMFYFKNFKDAFSWIKDNISNPNSELPMDEKELPKTDEPFAVFITDDNHLLISSAADSIHDPSNPYYVSDSGSDDIIFTLMFEKEQLPDPMCKYMVDHGFTDRFGLKSVDGEEHGRKLMQDNLKFFMTLVRQYQF